MHLYQQAMNGFESDIRKHSFTSRLEKARCLYLRAVHENKCFTSRPPRRPRRRLRFRQPNHGMTAFFSSPRMMQRKVSTSFIPPSEREDRCACQILLRSVVGWEGYTNAA